MSEIVSLKFEKRDFLYDNGLVNIFITLKKQFDNIFTNEIEYKNSRIKLTHQNIEFKGPIEELKEVYFILRENFYSNAFEETKNKKPYYDSRSDSVIIGPVLSVKPWLVRTERVKDILPRSKVTKEKLNELKKIVEEKKKSSSEKFRDEIQYGSKSEVFVYSPPTELGNHIARGIREIKDGNKCVLCSSPHTNYTTVNGDSKQFALVSTNLIFDFGTGDPKPSFRDFRKKEDIPICFMCDLIYKYGLTKNYFVNNRVFIISAPTLQMSAKIKEDLILDDKRLPENENIRTNFVAKQDFMAAGAHSLLLLLLYKLYNKIVARDELSLLHIYSFIVTGEDVRDLNVYNKTSYITQFFDRIKDIKDSNRMFLHSLINYAYYKDIDAGKTKNLPKEEVSYRILNGLPITSVLFDLSYHNLSLEKSGSKAKPSWLNVDLLYEFLKKYSEVIGMNDVKELHEICMLVGDRIGYFAAQSENKTLLYLLREIGNLEGLTKFFRDLEYEILKVDAGAIWNAAPDGKNENYSELIRKLLLNIQDNKDVGLVTSYLGIYAVQKYLSTSFAKTGGVKK